MQQEVHCCEPAGLGRGFGFWCFGVWCLVLRVGVWCLVFGVEGLVLRVWSLVFCVWCLVFGVEGLELEVEGRVVRKPLIDE